MLSDVFPTEENTRFSGQGNVLRVLQASSSACKLPDGESTRPFAEATAPKGPQVRAKTLPLSLALTFAARIEANLRDGAALLQAIREVIAASPGAVEGLPRRQSGRTYSEHPEAVRKLAYREAKRTGEPRRRLRVYSTNPEAVRKQRYREAKRMARHNASHVTMPLDGTQRDISTPSKRDIPGHFSPPDRPPAPLAPAVSETKILSESQGFCLSSSLEEKTKKETSKTERRDMGRPNVPASEARDRMTRAYDDAMAEVLPDYAPPSDSGHGAEVYALVQWLQKTLRWTEGSEGQRLVRECVLRFARSRAGLVSNDRRAATCRAFLEHENVKAREARPIRVDRSAGLATAIQAAELVAALSPIVR